MGPSFYVDILVQLAHGIPLTLELAALAVVQGALLGLALAMMRLSGSKILDRVARLYLLAFRGTPLLVQIFLIYYGLGQFIAIRTSFLWPILKQPYWCAVIALTLNDAAYASEVIRGGLLSVPHGQIEAAYACGMSRFLAFRRVVLPLAIRQALPAYSNEIIAMVKATSLASVITVLEVTGIAALIISETFRPIEVLTVAGGIYLAINFIITRFVMNLECRLNPQLRSKSIRRRPIPAVDRTAA